MMLSTVPRDRTIQEFLLILTVERSGHALELLQLAFLASEDTSGYNLGEIRLDDSLLKCSHTAIAGKHLSYSRQ